jgi:rare lipoprotein A
LKSEGGRHRTLSGVVLVVALSMGCASQQAPRATAPPPEPDRRETPAPKQPKDQPRKGAIEKGLASWYGEPYHGRRTASGEIYDMHEMTAAHRTLDFGAVVSVTRRDTGAEVRVRINDRGPFIKGRIIDLSFAAAKKIGLDIAGVAPVKVVVIGWEDPARHTKKDRGRTAEHPAGEDCLWVQVGAFSSMDNARRAERHLEDTGETAVIIEGPGGLHRVRVGPFDREQDAARALERISADWPEAKAVPCG